LVIESLKTLDGSDIFNGLFFIFFSEFRDMLKAEFVSVGGELKNAVVLFIVEANVNFLIVLFSHLNNFLDEAQSLVFEHLIPLGVLLFFLEV
tara:strand:- start:751 stop:1026 length:276 start_codon:yes stop_codon:yes gene_type:complete